jgi:hypothetical protein
MSSALMAQNSWKVTFNGKEVLNASTEDEAKNMITLKKSDLKKKKDFILAYHGEQEQKGWERTIAAYDSLDTELAKQKGTRFKLTGTALQSLFKKSKTIKIYTVALPADPKLKAAVRVRRVHLCTLILQ